MDIRKLLVLMRDNQSDRAVSREFKIHRDTVQRYRQWATQQDLFTDPLLSLGDLQVLREKTLPDPLPPQNHSSVEPFREVVLRLRSENVKVRALFARPKERGYGGSHHPGGTRRLPFCHRARTGRTRRLRARGDRAGGGSAGRLRRGRPPRRSHYEPIAAGLLLRHHPEGTRSAGAGMPTSSLSWTRR
jgi:hypothetical protein